MKSKIATEIYWLRIFPRMHFKHSLYGLAAIIAISAERSKEIPKLPHLATVQQRMVLIKYRSKCVNPIHCSSANKCVCFSLSS